MTVQQTMSPRDFAESLGFKRNYGNQLVKDGRVVMAPDGKNVLVAESLEKFKATKDPSHQGVADRHAAQRAAQPEPPPETVNDEPAPPDADPERYDFQSSKAKREHFAAMEAEASYRQKIRELLEAVEVRSVLAEIITVLRTSIEGIPYNLAPILAATSDETQVKSILSAEVEHALKTASESLARLGRGDL